MSEAKGTKFSVSDDWREVVDAENLRRSHLSEEETIRENLQYDDRMVTIDEMIAYGKAIISFDELYNCYKRVGETEEFDEQELLLIADFQTYYKLINADRLPRYESWMVYLAMIIRMFGSGKLKDWNEAEALQGIKELHWYATSSIKAEKQCYDQYLYLLDDES
jgi:hypothetical protein